MGSLLSHGAPIILSNGPPEVRNRRPFRLPAYDGHERFFPPHLLSRVLRRFGCRSIWPTSHCPWAMHTGVMRYSKVSPLSPNPPKDSGRGVGGATGEISWAPLGQMGGSAGGLQALLGAPMAACSGGDEGDGEIGHGKRRSRTGTGASLRGRSVGRMAGQLPTGRQAGSGMARSRARAPLNWASQGQRWGRCKVRRRAERVSRPVIEKSRRRRVLVVTICSPRPIRAVQRARLWAITCTAS